ncbi:MAG: hypothetical protein OXO52_00985 [Rhodospirillales bacterium]|nr:hypothetical protein [Rhodospirillales bacterium]MDE0382012.1 hypothetical protein [Rhodospirillales bacterium]
MPSRAVILTSLGQPGPKPFEFEPLARCFEAPSIKIGLEGHGAIVVDVHAANRLANAIRARVPERASQIDTCVEQAARRGRASG